MAWWVEGKDFVVWRRFVEMGGDRAMAVRLDALHAAQQSGCMLSLTLSDGGLSEAPAMMIAEAAVAANSGAGESEWRERWVRALVQMAAESGRSAEGAGGATEGIVAALTGMEDVIADMKYYRVWPWLGVKRRKQDNRAAGAPAQPEGVEEAAGED